jgi:hypothetical protein
MSNRLANGQVGEGFWHHSPTQRPGELRNFAMGCIIAIPRNAGTRSRHSSARAAPSSEERSVVTVGTPPWLRFLTIASCACFVRVAESWPRVAAHFIIPDRRGWPICRDETALLNHYSAPPPRTHSLALINLRRGSGRRSWSNGCTSSRWKQPTLTLLGGAGSQNSLSNHTTQPNAPGPRMIQC